MFNYQNRQYIFKQSGGDTWNFFCDSRQNLCYNTLTRRGIWSNAVVLHKNISPWFYAEMDTESTFHLLFQDNDGNILYSRLDGQSIKTVPVLSSKVSSVYNKQLYMAPLKNSIYLFYVLQHENSFMLACQILSSGRISNPKVIDYVSGSSLPCSILYDKMQNIYAFYQSYDGKFLQLGYKKLLAGQKQWSDFTPVTKYSGNCEYPHAITGNDGIIHLCYQRRAPKLFEMVYQQKLPDKNLWTPEVIVHNSVHSFENASILQTNDHSIAVYWVREDTIYYNTGIQGGNTWGKASRLTFTAGRQLQCLCYKANNPKVREQNNGDEEITQLSPAIYPGSLVNGLKLAFVPNNDIGDSPQLPDTYYEGGSSTGSDIRRLIMDSYKQVQTSIGEVREGLSSARDELSRLSNSYSDLSKELGKYAIRLNMLESRIGQLKKPESRQLAPLPQSGQPQAVAPQAVNTASTDFPKAETSRADKPHSAYATTAEATKDTKSQSSNAAKDGFVKDTAQRSVNSLKAGVSGAINPEPLQTVQAANQQVNENKEPEPLLSGNPSVKSSPSLEPDKLKEWQEWQEPKEWRESD